MEENTSTGFSEEKPHAGNEAAKEMIRIWEQETSQKGTIIKNRLIAFLKQALKTKFEGCLEQWRQFCQKIASIKFLMGESQSKWRATLEWALKFTNIDKVLADYYGKGVIPVRPVTQKRIREMIEAVEEPELLKTFRQSLLGHISNAEYVSWFVDVVLKMDDDQTLRVIAKTEFGAKWLENHFDCVLRASLESFPNINSIVILAEGEERSGRIIQKQVKKQEPLLPCAQNIVEGEESPFTLPLDLQTGSAETLLLRQRLFYGENEKLPDWLLRVEVQEITEDGTAVLAFEEEIQANYCRIRYCDIMFLHVAELWPHVNCLNLCTKTEVGVGKQGLLVTMKRMMEEAFGMIPKPVLNFSEL